MKAKIARMADVIITGGSVQNWNQDIGDLPHVYVYTHAYARAHAHAHPELN